MQTSLFTLSSASMLLAFVTLAPACGGAVSTPSSSDDSPIAAPSCSGGGSAVVVNSGSTNSAGFRIEVTPDGQATWHDDPPGNDQHLPNSLTCVSMDGATTLTPTIATKLFDDLCAAGDLASLRFDQCAKSVSFGTTTSLTYGSKTVADTECGSTMDARAQALSVDVADIEQAIGAACR